MWTMSITIFTSLLFVVNNKLLSVCRSIDFIIIIVILATSYIPYFGYLYMTDSMVYFVEQHFTFQRLFANPIFYLTCGLIISISFLIDLMIEAVSFLVLTDPKDLLREQIIVEHGNLTKEFQDKFKFLSKVQKRLALQEFYLREQEIELARAHKSGMDRKQIIEELESQEKQITGMFKETNYVAQTRKNQLREIKK
jgi:hypothetical protein